MKLVETHGLKCMLGHEPLFEDLDFEIGPGQVVHLQGNNGSGKSTFIRSLIGKQAVNEGTIRLGGQPMESLSPAERELIAPLVDQSPLLNWDVTAVDNLIDSVSVGPNLLSWFFTSRRTVRKRVLDEYGDLVEKFGLASVIHRPARELSIGQRRLLTLLRALRSQPDGSPRVLLLDEPLAGLRADRVKTVLNELQRRLDDGWAIIVAEHVHEIERLKPEALHFPYRKEKPEERSNAVEPTSGPASNCQVLHTGNWAAKATERQSHVETNGEGRDCLLSLVGLSAGYPSVAEPIVPNVDLNVYKHQVTAIVGPNAAGKSTLFRGVFNDEQTRAWIRGTVKWRGREVRHVRDQRYITSHEVAWIPQERFDFPGMTVEESLGGALITDEFRGIKAAIKDLVGGLRHITDTKRDAILTLVKRLHEKRPDGKTILESRWETLSGGERAIATLAMGLINTPTVVFLDEPAANLDVHALEILKGILRTYVETHDAGALLIEHRMSFLEGFADRVVDISPDCC